MQNYTHTFQGALVHYFMMSAKEDIQKKNGNHL